MRKAVLAELKQERLANNAVVAFLGALLMGQSWRLWEGSKGTTELLSVFTVPDITGYVVFTITAVLFIWSLFLALASIVEPLQGWGFRTILACSPVLGLIVLAAFILSWVPLVSQLPGDQWWSQFLFWGGVPMFFFLQYRIAYRPIVARLFRFLKKMYRRFFTSDPRNDIDSDCLMDVDQNNSLGNSGPLGWIHSIRPHCRLPESRVFWITTTMVVALFEICFVFALWNWLSAEDSASAVIRNVGLVIAGSVAVPLAIWRALVADRQASAAQQQSGLAERSMLNESYQKGAEMLGSEVLSVRMGGIYTLQRLSERYPCFYHIEVMRLFCAFVRHPTKDKRVESLAESDEKQDGQTRTHRADVQDIMQAIGSRNPANISLERDEEFKLYLRGADMAYLQVRAAKLSGSWLTKANLSGAILPYADLSGARLRRTDLSRAQLRHADLSNANLWDADITKAILYDANVTGADLCGINARSPVYRKAVRGLTQAQLDKACADPNNPPKLDGVLDAETGKPLIWRGKPCDG